MVHWPLIVVACLVAEHQLWSTGSAVALQELSYLATCGILVSGLGIQPVTPALVSGFWTTGPPEMFSSVFHFFFN